MLTRHPTHQPLGGDLVNRLLAADAQGALPRIAGMAPVSPRASIPSELVRLTPDGPDQVRTLPRIDWGFVNQHWAAWAERWDRDIGA